MSPFAPLLGQSQAIQLLTQAVTKGRIAPAYLFAGADGVGRGLAAVCFVEYLFSQIPTANQTALRRRIEQRNHPDLLWVEPTYMHQGKRVSIAEAVAAGIKRKSPPAVRLEQIREIGQFLSRSALEAPRSIVVIEQAETMAEAPANALLKTLEEPGNATLILIAPGVESLLPTLVSRCQKIPFARLPIDAMTQVLQHGQAEILQHEEVLQMAQGSPGAAITHWQELQKIPPELLTSMLQPPRSPREALSLARQVDQTIEPESQLWLINFLQQRYWQSNSRSSAGFTILPLQVLEQARDHLLRNVNSRLVWEVTLLKMVT